MVLVYIHGANATPLSFNFIRHHVGDGMMLSYDSNHGFKPNLERFKNELKNVHDIVFVAHSLGGIYALHLANAFPDRINQVISLSTPYGGHALADYAKTFMPFLPLLNDIGPNSWPISSLHDVALPCAWCNVVTTKGNAPWMMEPNDGVVSVASQRYRSDMMLIEVDVNHYEVMLAVDTINIIETRLDYQK
jgi:pimeloyl-ACP methyl ester carboxylesterase